jgi:hypothetical protein
LHLLWEQDQIFRKFWKTKRDSFKAKF